MPEDQQTFWSSPLSGITGFVANTLGLNQQQKKQIKKAAQSRGKEYNQNDAEENPILNYISQDVVKPAQKYIQNSPFGQTADFLIGRPYRAIKQFAEPIKDVYKGAVKINKGLQQFQNAGYLDGWSATKKIAGGAKDIIGGYAGIVPATFNLATGIIPTIAAGKLGYEIVKSGRQSNINNKLKQRSQKRKKFLDKGTEIVDRMKTQYVWQKIRNRNLQSKLNQNRQTNLVSDSKPIFINVENQGNPKSKDIGSIDKKQIIRAQQQYKQLSKHI